MNYDDTYNEMNTTLGDSGDITFTPEEKARAMQKAWNDSYAITRAVDSTLTFVTGTYEYAVPTALTTVTDIAISSSNNTSENFPESISKDLWTVENGTIYFRNRANNIIPTDYTLYCTGNKKLDYSSDTVTDTDMQEYLIALGSYNTLTLLGFKKANLFLKNDTSMAELISLKRDLKDEVRELRAKLQRSFEVA